jgi:ABC transporter substrate binding protein
VGKLQENVLFSGGLGAFRIMTRLQCATAMPLCKGYESTVTKTARTSISSTDGRMAISRGSPELVTDLVAMDPAVIVSAANTGAIALRQATAIVPIVSALLVDPIAFGLAESHNRPGRNVTDSCKRSTVCPVSKQSCWWSLCRRRATSVCW